MNPHNFRRRITAPFSELKKHIPRMATGGMSSSGVSDVAWRSFWRVVFDVVDSKPRLLFEMTLWDVLSNTRLARKEEILTPTVHDGAGGAVVNGAIPLASPSAVDIGPSWLEYSVNLRDFETILLNDAGLDPELNSLVVALSESLNGENISIRADVSLDDPDNPAPQPFFYLQQPSTSSIRGVRDTIRLYETLDSMHQRVINWWISGQQLTSGIPFIIPPGPNTQHGVRVRQDAHILSGGDVYEFLVDSLPLGYQTANPRNHLFNHEEALVFFIGAMPDPGDPSQMIVLEGTIAHLEFDPNNSCGGCVNPG